MRNKVISVNEALNKINDNMSLMVGGFLGVGGPSTILNALANSNKKGFTIIANDTANVDAPLGKLVVNKQVSKAIVTHIGTNPETGRQLNENEMEVILTPQGTLAEQIRCGGSGIRGFYTPTGVGTEVEIGKEKKVFDGVECLLEKAIKADVALIRGSIVDKKGNVYYNKSTRNFNPMMALAADLVIVEAEKIVEIGELDPSSIVTPGELVDFIIQEEV